MDVVFGYLIDGCILIYNLKLLKDDKKFFLLYDVLVLVIDEILKKYLELKMIINKLKGKILIEEM